MMKTRKCTKCNNSTHQEDKICVSCKLGLTQMYDELVDLLKKDKRFKFQSLKISGIR